MNGFFVDCVMRLFSLILAVLFLLAGIAFGALNSSEVTLDFYRWQFDVPLSVALLGAAFVAALAAGVVLWASVIWPLRMKLAASQRRLAARENPGEPAGHVATQTKPSIGVIAEER